MNSDTEHMPRERKRLNVAFLVLLFGFLFATHEAMRLFEPLEPLRQDRPKLRFEQFFEAHPFLSALALLVGVIAFFAASTKLLQVFWNRFVSDVFRIREISLVESLALWMTVGLVWIPSL